MAAARPRSAIRQPHANHARVGARQPTWQPIAQKLHASPCLQLLCPPTVQPTCTCAAPCLSRGHHNQLIACLSRFILTDCVHLCLRDEGGCSRWAPFIVSCILYLRNHCRICHVIARGWRALGVGARDLSNNSEGRCAHGNTYEAVPELRAVVAPSVSVSPPAPRTAAATRTRRELTTKKYLHKPTD